MVSNTAMVRPHGPRQPAARDATCLCALLLILAVAANGVAASEQYGQVTFGGLAVPGATVIATQGGQRVVTSTNTEGVYRFADLPDGVWTLRVEMLGFMPVERTVTVAADTTPQVWELSVTRFEEIARLAPPRPAGASPGTASAAPPAPIAAASPATNGGAARPGVTGATRATGTAPSFPEEPAADQSGAADGFLINGSVNNGAASPFAQAAAFGNNRRRGPSLYNFAAGVVGGSSVWDARPYSFTSQRVPKPDYNNIHVLGTFGGPIGLPHVPINRRLNVFVGYQHTADTNATTTSAIVPTALERAGDFSQSQDRFGEPLRVVDPVTGAPFAGAAIPAGRLSPQALALLHYYPQPNVDGVNGYNFEAPVIATTRQDGVQTRLTQPINTRNQLVGTVSYQRIGTDSRTLFGFDDTATVATLDSTATWTHRINQFLSLRPRFQFNRVTSKATPYFAGRTNVSGDAGISGNDQAPENWGPPALTFSSGIEPLVDAPPAFTRVSSAGGGGEAYWGHGRHNLTVGGDLRRQQVDIQAQQNPRGALTFNGAASGADFADFLLGIPGTSSIAFGNADKFLRGVTSDAYLTDDFRVSPSLTINAGVRWEYESPLRETRGRLVNLDVAGGFSAVSPVVASDPTGPLTGTRYDASLLRPDRGGVQPRAAIAWRPIPGSSVVVRAGYGIYRNTAVYQAIATLLAQQPPLSTSFTIPNDLANPFTLANPFVPPAGMTTLSTFAVDPAFRVGYAENWQASLQRDLPASLTVTVSYLGARGHHLMREFLPNTYPAGAADPCPACPSGFIYLTSDGSSIRNAGQIQVRRRLRNGFTAQIQYTLAKAEDDAGAFLGASLAPAAIAQDWRALAAERAPSNFDQRHLVAAQVQYSTGIGISGGTLIDGLKGALLKGWTLTSQVTAGSGLPFTPYLLTPVAGTGITGLIRPDLTGATLEAPSGSYLNPAAYAPPAAGRWGTAGRNSVRGPAQFSLNAAASRSFAMGSRLNLEWRVDATNLLNRVTYSSVAALLGSPQFGLANRANTMRKIQTSLRLRF
jgi:hypothetical protein